MKPSTLKRAVVAGATGAVGKALLARLRESDRYGEVHLLVRRKICATNPKLIEHLTDFDYLDQTVIDGPVDHVFCALGTTRKLAGSKAAFYKVDHDYVVAVGELAKRLDASLAVVSSVGASRSAGSFYLKVKGEAEASLTGLGLRRLVILRPSLLIARRQASRPLEELALRCTPWLRRCLAGPLKRYCPVRVEDVADSMVDALCGEGASVEYLENEQIIG